MEYKCDLCGRTGSGNISRLSNKLFFCSNCRDIHWDGVGPAQEEKFVAALLKAEVALPQRNSKGWFPLN